MRHRIVDVTASACLPPLWDGVNKIHLMPYENKCPHIFRCVRHDDDDDDGNGDSYLKLNDWDGRFKMIRSTHALRLIKRRRRQLMWYSCSCSTYHIFPISLYISPFNSTHPHMSLWSHMYLCNVETSAMHLCVGAFWVMGPSRTVPSWAMVLQAAVVLVLAVISWTVVVLVAMLTPWHQASMRTHRGNGTRKAICTATRNIFG